MGSLVNCITFAKICRKFANNSPIISQNPQNLFSCPSYWFMHFFKVIQLNQSHNFAKRVSLSIITKPNKFKKEVKFKHLPTSKGKRKTFFSSKLILCLVLNRCVNWNSCLKKSSGNWRCCAQCVRFLELWKVIKWNMYFLKGFVPFLRFKFSRFLSHFWTIFEQNSIKFWQIVKQILGHFWTLFWPF